MSISEHKPTGVIVDHLFRNEAGKMVAVLTRLFGFQNIEQAEDIVQDTLLKALEIWKFGKIPENPQAWLYRVAKNHAIDIIRRRKLKYKIDNDLAVQLASEYTLIPVVNEMFSEHEIIDSQLRMMFACCHPAVSQEAQITLMLNTLCGLSAREIATAFLTKEDTVNKRLYRTKEKFRNEKITPGYPAGNEIKSRTDAVLKTLYLLFNEGYNSSHPEKLIREDLCEEAIRLAILLTENARTNLPETNALLALMCYQASRLHARTDDNGFIILLREQDRTKWNQFLIQKGNEYLTASSTGADVHEYHLEAAVASVHSNAADCENTNWKMILDLYDQLLTRSDNPVVALNRCLALAEVEGAGAAIDELEQLQGLKENCYYNASLAELYLKAGKNHDAKTRLIKALSLTGSTAERQLIQRKMALC